MKHLYSILIGLALSVVIFFILLFVIGFAFEDKVKAIVVDEINKNLTSEIKADHINFTLIREFPNAAVEFRHVLAHSDQYFKNSVLGVNTDTAFYADKVSVKIGLLDILAKKYTIKAVDFENGLIKFFLDKKGDHNFNFWQKSEDKSGNSFVELNNVRISNSKLVFADEESKLLIKAFANKLNLNGEFQESEFKIGLNINLFLNRFKLGERINISNINSTVATTLSQRNDEIILAKGSSLSIGDGQKFNVDGAIGIRKNKYYNFNIISERLSLNDIKNIFQETVNFELDNIILRDGKGKIDVQIEGSREYNKPLDINVDLDIRNLLTSLINWNSDVTNISFKGNYKYNSNRSQSNSYINLQDFSFKIADNTFFGKAEYSTSDKAILNLNSDGFVSLKDLRNFFALDTISILEGQADFNIKYSGLTTGFKVSNLFSPGLSAKVKIKNGELQFKKSSFTYSDISGVIKADQTLYLDSLFFRFDDNDFLINGEARNINQFLAKNGELGIRSNIKSSNIDLDELIKKLSINKETKNKKYFEFPDNINLLLDLNVENFNLDNFDASNVRGKLLYKPKMFTLREISFSGMGGNAKIGGVIIQKYNKDFMVRSQSRIENIEIDKLFYSLNNFEQEYISDKHLRGKISGSIFFSSDWTNTLDIKSETIVSDANIKIENGELIQFEPMLGLSRFITVDELKHIEFSTLTNQISIQNNLINIPQMDIQSSAINIKASGQHSFDNDFDYRITLALDEIIAKKLNRKVKKESEFGTIEEDDRGRTMVHLSIKGTPEKYKVKLDRKKMRQQRRDNLKEEKQELKTILNEEFGWFKNDSSINSKKEDSNSFKVEFEEEDKKKKKKKKKSESESEQKFTIEFDEDTTKKN